MMVGKLNCRYSPSHNLGYVRKQNIYRHDKNAAKKNEPLTDTETKDKGRCRKVKSWYRLLLKVGLLGWSTAHDISITGPFPTAPI